MSHPSKPAASYFRTAAKILRLQKVLNRPNGSSKSNQETSISVPCMPITPSFQHSNGRRLSYSHYIHHHNQYAHHHDTHHHAYHTHHHHHQSEHFDTPFCALQHRRNTSNNPPAIVHDPTGSVAFKPTAHMDAVTSSTKLRRLSGPPSMLAAFTIHHSQIASPTSSSIDTHTSLIRCNSMPNRRRKRFSYQSTVAPFFQQFDSREVTTVSVVSVAPPQLPSVSRPLNATTASGSRSVQSDSVQEQQLTSKSIAILPKEGGHTPHEYSSSRFGTEELGQDVPNYLNFVSDPAATSKSQASPSNPSESFHATNLDNPRSFISGTDIDTAPADPDMAEVDTTSTMQHIMGNIRATTSAAYMSPKRSLTNSSLASSNGSVFSTATMPLADSSMSIQSHQSESSMLSAAMTASGLPSMDMMMDHVDRRLALDSQAQLVDNAHVGMAHVSFVDKHLIAEPCSAAIETWVN